MRRAWLVGLALATLASVATAAGVDARRVTRLSVKNASPYPMVRVDAARTGAVAELPARVDRLSRVSIDGALDLPAVIADGGAIVAATATGELARVASSGTELWRVRLPSPAAKSPVLTSGSVTVVVTEGGECLGFDPKGALRFRVTLTARGPALLASPVAMPDGGVVVASRTTLLHLDDDGVILARAKAPESPSQTLLADDRGVVMMTEKGRVLRWSAPSEPVVLGALGGLPSVSAALADDLLIAPIESQRLVLFDLATGLARRTIVSSTLLDGPASFAGGRLYVTTSTNFLLTYSLDGRELERIPLPLAQGTDTTLAPSATTLVTAAGRVVLVRPGGEVGVVENGASAFSEDRACAEPLGIAAVSPTRVAVSCHDGSVVFYGTR